MASCVRSHPAGKMSAVQHEPAPLEWLCAKCGKIFLPKRITWPTGRVSHSKCCGSCAWENLERFLSELDEEQIEE